MTPLTAPLTAPPWWTPLTAPPWWHWIRLYATHRWPTKAMTGNARRRELMAQVRERTRRRFDGDEWWRSDEPFDGNFEP